MRKINTGFRFWLLIVIVICRFSVIAQVTSESDLKKEGDRYFDMQDFEKALPDYSRLLSLYPNNNEYLYRFGVCQLMAGKERAGAFAYLEKASLEQKTPDEVWYYLGKSYLVINEFLKAKEAFNKFKSVNASKARKFDVDGCIQNAENGEQLIKARKSVVIMKSNEVAKSNFYSSYDFSNCPGKVVNASEEFFTTVDKARQKDPVMFMSNDKHTILISSYGAKGENGKDIYILRKQSDGSWTKPQNLGSVNSPKDEDFPFLDRDGKTLFFSSRGHNSMGGYDIFKSVYDYNTGQWSAPENMGVPVNTVYDDLLFVPLDNKNAVYSTDVESANSSITIRNIEVPGGLSEMLTISGEYIPLDQQVRRDARITALTSDGTGIITTVHTDPVTGKYDLVLSPGQSYMLVVEGGGYLPHATMFEIPTGLNDPVLKQVVRLDKNQQVEEMTVENYFSSGNVATKPTSSSHRSFQANADSSDMISITINNEVVMVPAPKSDMEASKNSVSEIETISNEEVKTESDKDIISEDAAVFAEVPVTGSSEVKDTASYTKDITNEEIARMAFADAKDIQKEADNLKQEAVRLRKTAADLDVYADTMKENAAGENDSIVNEQVATMKVQAGELRKQADEVDLAAAEKEKEAFESLAAANEIFKSSTGRKSSSNSSKNKTKEPGSNHQVKNSDIANTALKNETEVAEEKSVDSVVADTPVQSVASGNMTDNANISNAPVQSDTVSNVLQVSTVNSEVRTHASEDNNVIYSVSTVPPDNSKHVSAPSITESESTKDAQITNATLTENTNSTVIQEPEVRSEVAVTKADDTQSVQQSAEMKEAVASEKPTVSSNAEPLITEAPAITIDPENTTDNITSPAVAEVNTAIESPASVPVVSETESARVENPSHTDAGSNTNATPVGPVNYELPSATIAVEKEASPASNTNAPASPLTANVQDNGQTETVQPEPSNSSPEQTKAEGQPAPMPVNKNESVIATTVNSVNTKTENTIASPSTATAEKNNVQTNAAPVADKAEPGEAPKVEPARTFDPNDFPGYSKITVKEEAKVAYRQSQAKFEESNRMTNESLRMQDQISHLKSSPERDSLIRESNDLTLESMKIWKEGITLVEEARKAEPNIDYKMGVIDFANKNGSGDAYGINDNAANPVAMRTGAPVITETPAEVVVEPTVAKEDSTDEMIDTTHPDYPVYAKLQKEITEKQVETIDVFAQAINLSRLASDETDQANKLFDEAEMEKDSSRKAELIKSANELKALAASHDAEAKQKFEIAKGHTRDVKSLVAQMKEVKQRITLQPGQNLASVNKSNAAAKGGSEKELSAGGGLSLVEKAENKQMDAQQFAMAERMSSDFNATEAEIAAVNVNADEQSSFYKNVFSRPDGAVYSDANPIPMNPPLPDGLVFKIQIGAFKNPLPAGTFKGLQPLSGETTRPGWIRYCVGMFRTFEPANAVKNEIKRTGYKDAFVVAYYNGKRIDLNDAYTIIRDKENLTAYKEKSAKEFAILRKMNIRPLPVAKDRDVLAFYAKQPLPETLRENDEESIKALSEVEDPNAVTVQPLEYTVQLGVFNSPSAPASIASLKPLPASKVNGKYRYTTMTFARKESADSMLAVAVNSGVKDAFVVGLRNGNFVAMENSAATVSQQQWNTIVKEDVPSPEMVYKVQIGAFKNDVPYNIVETYLTISDKGITRRTDERGLHIFYAGSFKDLASANALRREISAKGIKDAFVVVLQNGKRVSIPGQ